MHTTSAGKGGEETGIKYQRTGPACVSYVFDFLSRIFIIICKGKGKGTQSHILIKFQ